MEYDVQDIKVSENLVQAEAKARVQKTAWILRCFPKPKTISLRDYQLILCMLTFFDQLQGDVRKLIPKGRSVIIRMHLWELACEFHVEINAII